MTVELMSGRPVLIAHADGDEWIAEQLAVPIRAAGYRVVHRGTVLIGDSVVADVSRALAAGAAVVLCGTVKAMGTRWAHQVVNAARAHGATKIYGMQVDREAFLDYLTFDTAIAPYWQDPESAVTALLDALRTHFPLATPRPHLAPVMLEQRFRDLLLSACDIIDLANLPADRRLATRQLLLRSLYVPLSVTTEQGASDEPDDSLAPSRIESVPDGSFASGRPFSHSRYNDRPSTNRTVRKAEVPKPVGQRLQAARRLVILGDPGAGKTTLLRWMATSYLLRLRNDPEWSAIPAVGTLPEEDWLPVLIRCRDLGPEQVNGSLEDILVHVLRRAEIAAAEIEPLRELIIRKLDEGTVLLLIDGLDEITDVATRTRFCRQLEQIHLARPATPIVATSRIVGYREMGASIGRGFEHLTLADLSRSDKDDFIGRWCAVTEVPARQQSSAAELRKDIHGSDRIERLTGNPMLLTTMALVKRNVGKLPEHRADLYREAVHVLLNWRAEVDLAIDHHEAIPQLEYVAFAMTERGVQQLTDDAIVDLLTEMRTRYPNVHAIHGRTPRKFINMLERRTGILVQVGHVRRPSRLAPVFEFRHLIFQEYLAALALVEGRFAGHDRNQPLAEVVGPLAGRVDSPDDQPSAAEEPDGAGGSMVSAWQEAIRLCVRICKDDDVDPVLRAVLHSVSGEDVAGAGARIVLAARCLEDEPNASAAVVDEILRSLVARLSASRKRDNAAAVIETLANSRWAEGVCRHLIDELRSRGAPAVPYLGDLLGRVLTEDLIKKDVGLQQWHRAQVQALDHADPDTRLRAAVSIGRMAVRGKLRWSEAANALTSIAAGADSVLASAATWALGKMRDSSIDVAWLPADAQIERLKKIAVRADIEPTRLLLLASAAGLRRQIVPIRHLIEIANDSDVADARIAIEMLGREPRSEATPVLTRSLGHDTPAIRVAAARALGYHRGNSALAPLVARSNDQNPEVREAVAAALGDVADDRAIPALLALLGDQYRDVRIAALDALGQIGDETALQPIVDQFRSEPLASAYHSVWALSRFASRAATDALLQRHNEENTLLRQWIVSAFAATAQQTYLEPLLAYLADHDLQVRSTAARTLGHLASAGALEHLRPILGDAETTMRASAVEGLAYLDDDRVLELLVPLKSDPSPEVRSAVGQALGKFSDARAAAMLLQLIDDDSIRVRASAAVALGYQRDERALPRLVVELGHAHPRVRAAAAEGLGWLCDTRSVSHLLSLLADPVAEVRSQVAIALANIGVGDLTGAVRGLEMDGDPWVRARMAYALGQLEDGGSVPMLTRQLSASNSYERILAANGLGALGGHTAVETLASAAQDDQSEVRAAAAEALGLLDGREAGRHLVALLTDSHSRVRAAALRSIGACQLGAYTDEVASYLTDRHPKVREAAVDALYGMNAEGKANDLTPLLDDPHPDVRTAAAWAVGVLGADQAVGRLVDLLGASHPRVVGGAIWALGQLGDSGIFDLLEPMVTSSNPRIRSKSAEALSALDPVRAAPILVDLLGDSSPTVRAQAASCLQRSSGSLVVELLTGALQDPASEVRCDAAVALGSIAELGAQQQLIDALSDPVARVRGRAAWALGRLGDLDAPSALQVAMGDHDLWVSARAVWAGARLGAPVDPRTLKARLPEATGVDRIEVTCVLGLLGDVEAQRSVQLGMNSGSHHVRKQWIGSFVWVACDRLDRALLSRDLDGVYPWIDPGRAIDDRRIVRAARMLRLELSDVQARYSRLTDHLPLTVGFAG